MATEAKTGVIIADLPLLSIDKVKSVIGRYDTAQGTLPLPEAPENWDRATLPGAAILVLLQDNPDDPAHGIPIWGGMVKSRKRNAGNEITLSLATLEQYFDTRYVGDYAPVGVGQNTILSNILTNYVLTGTPNGGIPLRIATSGTNTLRDRTYADQDNMTVYAAMQNFMGVQGGPEWTVGWEWQTSPERITPVCFIAPRIGAGAAQAGLGPNSTFEMPGCVKSFDYTEDYSNGKGANVVVASSSGTTTARPQSAPQTATDTARPTFEFRFTPSTSISDVNTLNSYATTAVGTMDSGTNSIALTAVVQDAPRLGIDWSIGDDVGYKIGPTNPDGSLTTPAFPLGLAGTARAIGWEIAISNTPLITPILTSSTL